MAEERKFGWIIYSSATVAERVWFKDPLTKEEAMAKKDKGVVSEFEYVGIGEVVDAE